MAVMSAVTVGAVLCATDSDRDALRNGVGGRTRAGRSRRTCLVLGALPTGLGRFRKCIYWEFHKAQQLTSNGARNEALLHSRLRSHRHRRCRRHRHWPESFEERTRHRERRNSSLNTLEELIGKRRGGGHSQCRCVSGSPGDGVIATDLAPFGVSVLADSSPSMPRQMDGGRVGVLHERGDVIKEGQYVIKGVLGKGGRGVMYEAETKEGGEVAVKALSLKTMSGWKELELFEREARVLKSLSHPGIPEYVDYFEVDSDGDRSFYLVQKVAHGKSLQELVAEKVMPLSEIDVIEIATEVLQILSYLESRRPPVVHRDIKPGNIIVDVKSARTEGRWAGHVRVVDFGAVQDVAMASTSIASTVVGTYGYMAPEQFQNRAVSQSDLYALGGTMLFLLSGQAPSAFPQKRLKVQFRDRVKMSGRLKDILDQLLEPAPEDRFASAEDVLRALKNERQPRGSHGRSVQVLREEGRRTAAARRKPVGTQVSLSVTEDEMAIEIPAVGLTPEMIAIAGFAAVWNTFVGVWTGTAIAAGAPIIFPLFSIPFWAAGIHLARTAVSGIMTKTYLEIVAGGRFTIRWNIGGVWEDVKEGLTQDLVGARAVVEYRQSDYMRGGESVVACELIEGVREHRFGLGLMEMEKRWLVGEINEFLISSRASSYERNQNVSERGDGRVMANANQGGEYRYGSGGTDDGGERRWLLASPEEDTDLPKREVVREEVCDEAKNESKCRASGLEDVD